MFIAPDASPFISLGVVHTGAVDALRDARENRHAIIDRIATDLRAWGFNSVGYHHPPEIRDRLPFIADTHLARTPYLVPKPLYPDVFGGFGGAARHQVHAMCAQVKSNPNLIGYYWTDTPRWDLDAARRLVNDDWVSAIRRNKAIFPGKQRYIAFLRERHSREPDRFRKLYGMSLDDPAIVDADFARLPLDDPVVHRDDYDFLRLIAREYYRAAGEAMEREDRKHLVLGDRYLLNDLPVEVLEEALPWIDVVAVQPSQARFEKTAFDRIYRIARKPILICDHAINFPTEHHPRTGWPQCATEADAALGYEQYMADAFATPYIVGYHRCHYMNRFSARRNLLMQGLVREDWKPYETLVEATGRANRSTLAAFSRRTPADR